MVAVVALAVAVALALALALALAVAAAVESYYFIKILVVGTPWTVPLACHLCAVQASDIKLRFVGATALVLNLGRFVVAHYSSIKNILTAMFGLLEICSFSLVVNFSYKTNNSGNFHHPLT